MSLSVQVHREVFSAMEAEKITGVSQHVMRDWTRRKLMKPRKVAHRTIYNLEDLSDLIVLKTLTSLGMAVGAALKAAPAARFSVVSVAEEASCMPDEAFFVGIHGVRIWRYLVCARNGRLTGTDTLDSWLADRERDGQDASSFIVDCRALGHEIARRAPRPVVRLQWNGAR